MPPLIVTVPAIVPIGVVKLAVPSLDVIDDPTFVTVPAKFTVPAFVSNVVPPATL